MKIERPDWDFEVLPGYFIDEKSRKVARIHNSLIEYLNKWFDENVEPVNKMLSEGVELYADKNSPEWLNNKFETSTHKALLINVQKLKPKSREEKLEEFVKEIIESGTHGMWSCELIKKAKELLDEK